MQNNNCITLKEKEMYNLKTIKEKKSQPKF